MKSLMRVQWDIVPHDAHEMDAEEQFEITEKFHTFAESLGYRVGGWSSMGSVLELEKQCQKFMEERDELARENEQLRGAWKGVQA